MKRQTWISHTQITGNSACSITCCISQWLLAGSCQQKQSGFRCRPSGVDCGYPKQCLNYCSNTFCSGKWTQDQQRRQEVTKHPKNVQQHQSQENTIRLEGGHSICQKKMWKTCNCLLLVDTHAHTRLCMNVQRNCFCSSPKQMSKAERINNN